MATNRGYVYSHNSQRHISSTEPLMQLICQGAIEIANKRKTYCPDFGISCGKRTAQEQFELFQVGRKQYDDGKWRIVGKVITYCDGYEILSVHQLGYAIDFFAIGKDGKVDYSPQAMALVATCFFEAASNEQVDIDWGGSFQSISDTGHVEVKNVAT